MGDMSDVDNMGDPGDIGNISDMGDMGHMGGTDSLLLTLLHLGKLYLTLILLPSLVIP